MEAAAGLVRLKVDVIVTVATSSTLAAKQATSVIPIVSVGAGDPVGLAWSLAWRDLAAMSQACQFSRPILLASVSNCCVTLFPVCGD
jgi:ABC-type uncharacterized transport system substrate-binding protein